LIVSKFRKWASTSLIGHIALLQLIFALPFYLIFLRRIYLQGGLTVGWGLYMACVVTAASVVSATLIWYTVSRPLIEGRKR
jgi:peptidoglycan/LPS O-acetylase OafA/YrhL